MTVPHAAYAFSWFAIPPALTTVVAIAAAVRLGSVRLSRVIVALFGMLLPAMAWQGSFTMMYLATDEKSATAWAKAGYASVVLLAPATYQLVVELLRNANRRRSATFIAWLIAAQLALVTLATDVAVTGVRRFSWGFYPALGIAASVPVIFFFIAYMLAAGAEIRGIYPQSMDSERARIRLFAIALAIGCMAFVDFLPGFGVPIYPFGSVGVIGFLAVTAYARRRYGLVPVTPSLAANQIIANMRDVLLVSDRDGRIQFANEAAYALLGYGPSEMIGQQMEDFIVPKDETNATLRGRSVRDREFVFRSKAGEEIELSLSTSPIVHEDQKAGAVLIGRDLRERKRYERETRRAVTLLQSTLDSTADGILVIGAEGTILTWNQRFAELWRIPAEVMEAKDVNLVDQLVEQLIDPAEFLTSLEALRAHPEVESFHILEFKDGRRFEQYSIGRYLENSALRVWSFRDVTDRVAAENALRDSEERYRTLFEQNAAGVCLTTRGGEIVDCNATFAEMLGYAADELTSRDSSNLFDSHTAFRQLFDRLDQTPTLRGIEVELRRRDGAHVWALVNVSILGRGDQALVHMTAVDISDRKRAEEQIEFHAYHDVLTQLPNRRLFVDRLEMCLLAAKRSRRNVAVLFIDLDRFKVLNDTLGHSAADALLLETARRLKSCVRQSDTVARFGGDEFTVILPDLTRPEDAVQVAEKVIDTIAQPVTIGGTSIDLSASIGVAVYPHDGEDFDTLLRNADNAMYRAKESGRNTYQLCTDQLKQKAVERLSLQSALRRAIAREELTLVYQPQVMVDSGDFVGAEALVRWNDPERGFIEPNAFIPIAEDTRMILPLGEWILHTACRQVKEWRDQGLPAIRVAVNLSARQFQQRDLLTVVRRAIDDCGIDPTALELEITETTAMQDVDMTVEVLLSLRQLGLSIAIDDFGSGYSSLGYLQQLPINAVKIDRRFISGVALTPVDGAIVGAVIEVARTLDLRVIAEGVETREQLKALQQRRCQEAQGYYFSRPVDPAALGRLLREKRFKAPRAAPSRSRTAAS